MRAAAALQERGELSDEQATEMVDAYNAEVRAANERGLDVASLPEELRPATEAILKAAADLEVPPDPADAAIHQLNRAIRAMPAPTLEQQLEALGLQVEQVPQPQEG